MSLDAAAARRIVDALDLELRRRQSKKDEAEDARWAEECGADEIILMARRLARACDRPRKGPPAQVPSTREDIEISLEELTEYAKSLFTLAQAVVREEEFKAGEAAGTLRRAPVFIGPLVRPAAMASKAKPVVLDVLAKQGGENGKAPRKSRTEIWREQQAAEAAARQALPSPRPAAPVPQQTEMGWFRGEIKTFDQRAMIGTVKFVGMVGITEAALAPGAARRSGAVNYFPGDRVDCRLVRHLAGFVAVEDLKLSSGVDPAGSAAAQSAADAERYQVHLRRNKWVN